MFPDAPGVPDVYFDLIIPRYSLHSANAQFFINLADNDFLDHPGQDGWGYCVFGRVVEGMETVDAIAAVKTGGHHGHQDVPEENVLIERAEIID